MSSFSITLTMGSILLADRWFDPVIGSSVYENPCKGSEECAIYPNLTQGPELIWLPFFCNEKGTCGCPNRWIPDVKNNICTSLLSDYSTSCSCMENLFAIGLVFVILIAILVYSFTSLLSKRYNKLPN